MAQDADLICSRALGKASFQVVGAGDRLRCLRDGLQRPERATRDQPARQQRGQQGGDRGDDQKAEQALAVGRLDTDRLAGNNEALQPEVEPRPASGIQPKRRTSWYVDGGQSGAMGGSAGQQALGNGGGAGGQPRGGGQKGPRRRPQPY